MRGIGCIGFVSRRFGVCCRGLGPVIRVGVRRFDGAISLIVTVGRDGG